ncbi:MAG: ATP-binding cassette domain-containing protein, partial [Clostridia bacterium]|nr:ATP-binding cassette domain-containing protein [Clostridia bacterium]
IVGESGSGKSVTSKAILGILAANSIIEGGEIIYDGQDLLKITEDEFHKIRGDKIAMIFQDPMSSLNPIVKIGKQLTEAMVLKGKARQRESRTTFNTYLKALNRRMIEAQAQGDSAKAAELSQKCKQFDKFEYKHLELEGAYNDARQAAEEATTEIATILFEIEKNALTDGAYRIGRVCNLAMNSINDWVVAARAEELVALVKGKVEIDSADKELLAAKRNALKRGTIVKAQKGKASFEETSKALAAIKEILDEALTFEQPNFFAMGYYLTFSGEKTLPAFASIAEMNAYLRKYLDDSFMLSFINDAKQGIVYSGDVWCKEMGEAIACLKAHRSAFEQPDLDKKTVYAAYKAMAKEVIESIDPLNTVKDSMVYTFDSGMKSELEKYLGGIKKNAKEEKRYTKEKTAYDKLIAKGKTPDGEVVPASYTDLEFVRKTILRQIDQMAEHLEQLIAHNAERDFDAETVAMIDFLKANASGVVNKVTKRVAKARAIKLMEEVGISEPRKRYNQYPFEFSGGMRQRIVIAIALAADPDILICDEPTTALDVTIQSRILELINKLKRERNLSIIFITHDLGVVANMADRIAVMYAGKIVEYGTSEDIFYHAAHPYTWALLSSMPDLDTNEKLDAIPGTPPNMIYPPVGDAFAARNKYAMKIDFERQPPMFKISDTHHAATWLLHPDAPKVDPPKTVTDRIARMQQKRGVSNDQ